MAAMIAGGGLGLLRTGHVTQTSSRSLCQPLSWGGGEYKNPSHTSHLAFFSPQLALSFLWSPKIKPSLRFLQPVDIFLHGWPAILQGANQQTKELSLSLSLPVFQIKQKINQKSFERMPQLKDDYNTNYIVAQLGYPIGPPVHIPAIPLPNQLSSVSWKSMGRWIKCLNPCHQCQLRLSFQRINFWLHCFFFFILQLVDLCCNIHCLILTSFGFVCSCFNSPYCQCQVLIRSLLKYCHP